MFERAATGDGRAITLLLVVGGMLTAPGRMGSPYLPRSAPIAQGIEQRFPKLWIATLSDRRKPLWLGQMLRRRLPLTIDNCRHLSSPMAQIWHAQSLPLIGSHQQGEEEKHRSNDELAHETPVPLGLRRGMWLGPTAATRS